MSTGYGWDGLRQVCGALLSAHRVAYLSAYMYGGIVYLEAAITSVRTFTFTFLITYSILCDGERYEGE